MSNWAHPSGHFLRLASEVCRQPNLDALKQTLLGGLVSLFAAKEGVLYTLNETAERCVPWYKTFNGSLPDFSLEDAASPGRVMLASEARYVGQEETNSALGALGRLIFPSAQLKQLALVPFFYEGFRPGFFTALLGEVSAKEAKAWCAEGGLRDFGALVAAHTKLFQDKQHLVADQVLLNRSLGVHRKQRANAENMMPGILASRIVGSSPEAQSIRKHALTAARSSLPLLLTGETGTGKDLLAEQIHQISPHSVGPFVAVNLAAIPEARFEQEFFGSSSGSTRESQTEQMGLIDQANGGTLYLDEIAEISLPIQAKLLRVLQETEVRPLGASRAHPVKVRLISATNSILRDRIEKGQFRPDLLYRIRQQSIHLPPLRDRGEDVIDIARHVLSEVAGLSGTPPKELTAKACNRLLAYSFPGNVRELKALIASAAHTVTGLRLIDEEALESLLERSFPESGSLSDTGFPSVDFLASYREAKDQFESAFFQYHHKRCGGNRQHMSERLDLPKRTLADKLKKYHL